MADLALSGRAVSKEINGSRAAVSLEEIDHGSKWVAPFDSGGIFVGS